MTILCILKLAKKATNSSKPAIAPPVRSVNKERKPKDGFMANLPAPARRALESKEIDCIEKLAFYSEKEILSLHGMGKGSIPKLKAALQEKGLAFKNRE